MIQSFFKTLFGCGHQRTTFPLTPGRRVAGHPASSTNRSATYVVCLDCGQEFAYDWTQMRVGQPVTSGVAPTLVTASPRPTITA
jgi:hypothetical protein